MTRGSLYLGSAVAGPAVIVNCPSALLDAGSVTGVRKPELPVVEVLDGAEGVEV